MAGINHVMVDLETLGVVPGCVAFSIGAVEFFPEEQKLGSEFEAIIGVEWCLDIFLREEKDTKEWWDKQAPEARATLDEARSGGGDTPATVLNNFNSWLKSVGPSKSIRLYGNGADFDNPILRVMYDAAGVKPYAGAYGGRCYRTLKNLDELLGPEYAAPKLQRQGTYHNALDDAKTQAVHLMEIVAKVRGA